MAIIMKGKPAPVVHVKKPDTTVYASHLGGGVKPAPQKYVAPQAVAVIETSYKHADGTLLQGSTDTVVHKGLMLSPEDEPCQLAVSGSRTVNLGNYESVKIGVTLTMPTAKKNLAESYDFVTDWVSEKLTEAVAGFKKEQ